MNPDKDFEILLIMLVSGIFLSLISFLWALSTHDYKVASRSVITISLAVYLIHTMVRDQKQ